MALIEAIKQENLEKVLAISSEISEKRRKRVLNLACKMGSFKIVKYLIESDENLNTISHTNFETHFLHFLDAVTGGHLQIVEYLHHKIGIFVNALKEAAEHGHYEVVKYLYTNGKSNYSLNDINEAFERACKGGCLDIIKYLLVEAKADVTSRFNNPVMIAAEHGHLEVVKYLCTFEDVNVRSGNDYALHWSCANGHLEMVKFLIEEKGADPMSKLNFPIEQAAQYGHLQIVQYLQSKGANLRSNIDYPLRIAAYHGHLEVVKFLTENGADVRSKNNFAIRRAAEEGHLEVVKYLHEAGADINILNYYAIKWASINGHLQVVKYIYENSDPLQLQLIVDSLVVYAYTNRSFEVIKYLIEKGADSTVMESIPYFLFIEKMQKKIRERAQKKIYFWWIPISYSLEHHSGCGRRMMLKNYQNYLNIQ